MKKRVSKSSMHPIVGMRVFNIVSQRWGLATGHLSANTTQPPRVTVKCDDGSFAVWPLSEVVEGMDL